MFERLWGDGPLKSFSVVLYDGADVVPFGDGLAALPLSRL
jgi:hypothetical protein